MKTMGIIEKVKDHFQLLGGEVTRMKVEFEPRNGNLRTAIFWVRISDRDFYITIKPDAYATTPAVFGNAERA